MLNEWHVNRRGAIVATHHSANYYTEVYETVSGHVHFRVFDKSNVIVYDSVISQPNGYTGLFSAVNAAHQWRSLQ
jgi:hypothetical protein